MSLASYHCSTPRHGKSCHTANGGYRDRHVQLTVTILSLRSRDGQCSLTPHRPPPTRGQACPSSVRAPPRRRHCPRPHDPTSGRSTSTFGRVATSSPGGGCWSATASPSA